MEERKYDSIISFYVILSTKIPVAPYLRVRSSADTLYWSTKESVFLYFTLSPDIFSPHQKHSQRDSG